MARWPGDPPLPELWLCKWGPISPPSLSSNTALLPFQTPSCPSPLGTRAPSPLPPFFPLHSCPDRTRFGWCSRQDMGRT